jgi:hypothetical protein
MNTNHHRPARVIGSACASLAMGAVLLAVRAAAISRAASRSSRNFGNGSGRGGMSRPMTWFRAGASGQSYSMIRSKNTRSIRSRWRCVFAVRPSPRMPG